MSGSIPILSILFAGWTGAFAQPAVAEQKLVTGSRSWRMADGSSQRMRFLEMGKDGSHAFFQTAEEARKPVSMNKLSAEEGAVLDSFQAGRMRLVTTPGLSMHPDLPAGKRGTQESEAHFLWVGQIRDWQISGGKRVSGALINLTDEDASILSGDFIGRFPLEKFAPKDVEYLEEIKRGEERMFPQAVVLCGLSSDEGPNYRVVISGERYVGLASHPGDFEKACAAANDHVRGKLKEKNWEMISFSEKRAYPATVIPTFNGQPGVAGTAPLCYEAEFLLKPGAVREAVRHWPLTIDPSEILRIHVLADGEIAPAEILR